MAKCIVGKIEQLRTEMEKALEDYFTGKEKDDRYYQGLKRAVEILDSCEPSKPTKE